MGNHIVLGGSGSIGSELARRLAAAGGAVVIAGRDRERLDAIADEVGGRGVVIDGRDPEQVLSLAREVAEDGLDSLSCCIGSIALAPAHATSADAWGEVIATNLTTAFACVRAAGTVMPKGGGGSVALVSSAAATTGMPNHEAVAAAKAGVEGLVRAAAATYAGRGIRVNAVAPGLVRTPLAAPLLGSEAMEKASLAMHPLGRLGEPADIAAALAWMHSPEASWMSGEIIRVDGGLARLRGRASVRV